MGSTITIQGGEYNFIDPNKLYYTKKETRYLIDKNCEDISKLSVAVDKLKYDAGLIPTEENLSYYYTKEEVDERISSIDISADLSDYYTKEEIGTSYYNKSYINNNYYTKADIDDKEIRNNTLVSREIEEAISPLNTSISNIDSNLTSNYLTKNEIGENFYNKAQINGMLEDIQSAGGTGIELKTQAQYNALENPDSNKIYFIYE